MIDYVRSFGMDDDAIRAHVSPFRDDLFSGQTVLVSGAATGIGRGIAALFARLGAALVICGRDAERLDEAAEFLASFGHAVDPVATNIRDVGAVEALMDHVFAAHGGLDHLINNAGGQFAMDAIDISPNGWRAVVDTNLNGTWTMMQNAALRWREAGTGGNIITITATTEHGLQQMAHTVASRAGVNALTRSLAVEWAPMRIRVNTVAPGVIASSGFNNYAPEEAARFERANPMKRAGDLMDIAEACVYLSASSGKFITGQTLTVAGGMDLYGGIWPAGKPEWFED